MTVLGGALPGRREYDESLKNMRGDFLHEKYKLITTSLERRLARLRGRSSADDLTPGAVYMMM